MGIGIIWFNWNHKNNNLYIYIYKSKTKWYLYNNSGKNQEDKIEGLLRSVLFKITYGTEEYIKNIIVVDLNSKDDTKKIIERMSEDNENIKVTSWKECRELFDNIDDI